MSETNQYLITLENHEREIYNDWVQYNQAVSFDDFMKNYINNHDMFKFKFYLKHRDNLIEDCMLQVEN